MYRMQQGIRSSREHARIYTQQSPGRGAADCTSLAGGSSLQSRFWVERSTASRAVCFPVDHGSHPGSRLVTDSCSPSGTDPSARAAARTIPKAVAEGGTWLCNPAGRAESLAPATVRPTRSTTAPVTGTKPTWLQSSAVCSDRPICRRSASQT